MRSVVGKVAMGQVFLRELPFLLANVKVRLCEICGGQSSNGTGFSPGTSISPCQYQGQTM